MAPPYPERPIAEIARKRGRGSQMKLTLEHALDMLAEIEQIAATAMEFAPDVYAEKFADIADRAKLVQLRMSGEIVAGAVLGDPEMLFEPDGKGL